MKNQELVLTSVQPVRTISVDDSCGPRTVGALSDGQALALIAVMILIIATFFLEARKRNK